MADNNQSPLTGILDEDKVFIDFGEHEGKSVMEIAYDYPDYYSFMLNKKKTGDFIIRRWKDKSYRLYIHEHHTH